MGIEARDPVTIRKYLLGDLPESQQQDVEEWLMQDDEASDEIAAAEDDLIDEYLRGRLDPAARHKFLTHFSSAPERQQKLEFARSFHTYLTRPEETSESKGGLWTFLRMSPTAAYAVAAAAVLVLTVGTWSAIQIRQLNLQVAGLAQERDRLTRDLKEKDELQAQLREELRLRAEAPRVSAYLPPPPDEPVLVASLLPGLTRTDGSLTTVALSPRTGLVRFRLTVLEDQYKSYSVVLSDASGKEISRQDGLSVAVVDGVSAIVVEVAATGLAPDDYTFRLSGQNAGNVERVASYSFRVVLR